MPLTASLRNALQLQMQMVKLKSPKLAQFGLMHLLATNMCVWLNTIIEETNVEIRSAELTGERDEGELGARHSTANIHQNSPGRTIKLRKCYNKQIAHTIC